MTGFVLLEGISSSYLPIVGTAPLVPDRRRRYPIRIRASDLVKSGFRFILGHFFLVNGILSQTTHAISSVIGFFSMPSMGWHKASMSKSHLFRARVLLIKTPFQNQCTKILYLYKRI